MIIQCKCDCGTEFEEYNKWGHKREYVQGHNNRGQKYIGKNNPMYGKHHSPKTRQLISIATSGENNPNYGKTPSPETRQLISENRIGKCCGENNPMYGKKHSPKTKQLMSINHADVSGENHPMYGKHPSDATKQKMRTNHADNSGEKHPLYGKTPSDATKKKIGKKNKGKILSPETRQLISKSRIGKYCGENNSQWKGGISFEPYCFEFTDWLKNQIKDRDDYQCQNPNCDKEITRNNPLGIHHINYQKKDCSCNNLITLCKSCNSRANANRECWQELYTSIIKNNINNRGNINDN